ncbi:MAG: TIGR03936 family radical SAM-associated protein [Synergistaceae bacterium]|jgi:radical SAM-linked protein|nr:TIGR03936 family radical SAM-associated protein [Synergistaceae bacterium]
MPRVRIFFSKSGRALFVPHVDLPVLFARAARRAGFRMEYTQGFSPHPKTEFGPPLPVGVKGVSEPAEFWFLEWSERSLERWAGVMPDGFALTGAREVSGQSLSKLCRDASYTIRFLNGTSPLAAAPVLEREFTSLGTLMSIGVNGNDAEISVTDLERSGASKMVKALTAAGLASGWPDIVITRTAVGRMDGALGRVIPLREEESQ